MGRENDPRREKRKALFDAVRAAYQQGLTKQAIARGVGITRTTVRRLLKTEEFSERAPRQQRSGLDHFRPYLESRWAEGATMRPNCVVSCGSGATAVREAG